MKEFQKVRAKLKHKPEDFQVEEIKEDWHCKTIPSFDQAPQIDNLEENPNKNFLCFELVKKDLEHFLALNILCKRFSKGTKAISSAGIKDKVAITSQRISVFQPDLNKIRTFTHPNIYLHNFKWSKRKIKMGYLDANNFRLTLRDIDKKDAIKAANKIRKTNIFPNSFGPQRFGNIRKNNVKIGKLLVKRDFEKAVKVILTELSEAENPQVTHARKKYATEKNVKEAIQYYPSYLKLEKEILSHLQRKPDDHVGAIRYANRKNILLYINALQSKIFNEILDRALAENIDFTIKGQQNIPLFGYKSRFSQGKLGEIEKETLKNHEIELEDFNIIEIPPLRIKGAFRKAITKIEDLKVEIEDDEEFESSKKIVLEFTLPSGVYATTFLDKFFEFIE